MREKVLNYPPNGFFFFLNMTGGNRLFAFRYAAAPAQDLIIDSPGAYLTFFPPVAFVRAGISRPLEQKRRQQKKK